LPESFFSFIFGQPTDVSRDGRRSMLAPFCLPALTSAGFADAALRQIKGAEVANGGGVVISAHRGGGTVFGT
jgi:hypothetical protein